VLFLGQDASVGRHLVFSGRNVNSNAWLSRRLDTSYDRSMICFDKGAQRAASHALLLCCIALAGGRLFCKSWLIYRLPVLAGKHSMS
jgi:hypothetical protein